MKANSDEKYSWLGKVAKLMEQDILGVKLGIYGVGLISLSLALKHVRPFKKIVLPNDIPKSFVKDSVNLKGTVVGLEFFPKTLLAIDHEPLLGTSLRRTARLPVDLEGITITANGVSWLQNIVVGQKVDFIVLEKHPKYLCCIVNDHKRNIGNHLVAIGFASVAPFKSSLESNEIYKKYYKKLLQTENVAEKRGNGIWWDRPRKFSLLDYLISKLSILKLKTALRVI